MGHNEQPLDQGTAVVVVNPIKTTDLPGLIATVSRAATTAGLPVPRFMETTPDDPGTGQAREALAAGASAVIAAGGDGTVRAVASALCGSGVAMGIIPLGTGNLLARNLALPLGDLGGCARIALTAPAVPLDLGWLTLDDDGESSSGRADGARQPTPGGTGAGEREVDPVVGREHAFLVIAGIGFDAEMVEGADDGLKKRLGWLAYFFVALGKLFSRRMLVQVGVDGTERVEPFRARSVMVANTGSLPGGIVLAPDAAPDDGWLDVLALDTRAGLIGWTSLGVKVLAQGVGIRGRSDAVSMITSKRGRTFRVRASRPEPVQVDGEWLGRAAGFRARVDAGALRVRK
ncbi:MAG: diacylglycerol kinase family protein [bacterium]|nr:diacylglycerol kinase family protein [bacterium]